MVSCPHGESRAEAGAERSGWRSAPPRRIGGHHVFQIAKESPVASGLPGIAGNSATILATRFPRNAPASFAQRPRTAIPPRRAPDQPSRPSWQLHGAVLTGGYVEQSGRETDLCVKAPRAARCSILHRLAFIA
jgi:hypothetical protein